MNKGLGKGLGALIAMFDEENEAIKKSKTESTVETHSSLFEPEVVTKSSTNVPRGTKLQVVDESVLLQAAPMLQSVSGQGVQEIDINLIDNNTDQPRKSFDPVQLQELADSISANGVFQPILVNKVGSRFMIIAGERRWRASKMAGLVTVPALVKEYSPRQIQEIAIVENLQRENLNDIELAVGVKKLMDDFLLTQEKVAKVLGKSRSSVANILRLLNLPKDVQMLVETNQLSSGHAKCLVAVSSADASRLAKKCVLEGLSVRQLEDYIRDMNDKQSSMTTPVKKNPELRRIAMELTELYGTKAIVQGNETNGRIIFEYYDRHDLERITKKLLTE